MNTYVCFWSYLAQSLLEWEMFQTEVVEKIKTNILCSGYKHTLRNVILIDSPLQICLDKRAIKFRYTHIACLVTFLHLLYAWVRTNPFKHKYHIPNTLFTGQVPISQQTLISHPLNGLRCNNLPVFRTVLRNTVTLCEQTAGNVNVKTSVNAVTFGFWIMKDVSSKLLFARYFKTDDINAFFHQNFTAQFRGSQSEVQFTTNTNPIGKATILKNPPLPQQGQTRNFLNTTSV
jgi:hypothetical protein